MSERPPRKELASSIGQSIRAARNARDLTQERVAELVGVSPEFYARLERGRALPSVTTLMLIIEVLDASPGALLDGAIALALEQPADQVPEDFLPVLEYTRARPSSARLFIALIDMVESYERPDR